MAKVPNNIPDRVAATLNCAFATMVNAVSSEIDLENLEEKREENKQKSVLVQVGDNLIVQNTCRHVEQRLISCL